MRALVLAVAIALTACGGGGTGGGSSSSSLTPAQVALQQLDAIDAQAAAGALTQAQAASARLDVVHHLQAVDPSAVKIGKMPRSTAPADVQAKMKPEMEWYEVFIIVTRGLMLSGDTCPSCDLEERPIDFGQGDGWN